VKYNEGISKKNLEASQTLLINMLVSGGIAFHFAENRFFKQYVNCLNPNYNLPAKTKLKELFDIHYMSTRELMIKKLSALEFISITTDLWTSKYQKKSYGGFTAHGISINMKPIAIKLGIHEISIAHTAENLEIFIKKVLRDFSIYEKVLFHAVDNPKMLYKYEKRFHRLL